MDKSLARESAEIILALMDWARELPSSVLDGDPEQRRLLVKDFEEARRVVRLLNAADAPR